MRIGVVGGGAAGLSCAAEVIRSVQSAHVTVLEKSAKLSGRAASRTQRQTGSIYDNGANYIKIENSWQREWVENLISRNNRARQEFVEIVGSVDTFSNDGVISPGDPARNTEKKWTLKSGINTLGYLIAEDAAETSGSALNILTKQYVSRLSRDKNGKWHVGIGQEPAKGERVPEDAPVSYLSEPFDVIVLAAPAPQTLDIIRRSGASLEGCEGLFDSTVATLSQVTYRAQFAVALGFKELLARPANVHALLNLEGGHDVAWVAFENDKQGHVNGNNDAMVAMVQMSEKYTLQNYDAEAQRVAEDAARHLGKLLGGSAVPAWSDVKRWRYALPHAKAVDLAPLQGIGSGYGLFFTGDWAFGKGRVMGAVQNGHQVGQNITAWGQSKL